MTWRELVIFPAVYQASSSEEKPEYCSAADSGLSDVSDLQQPRDPQSDSGISPINSTCKKGQNMPINYMIFIAYPMSASEVPETESNKKHKSKNNNKQLPQSCIKRLLVGK